MKDPHRLLKRQIRRFLPPGEPMPEPVERLLEAVNAAYYESDEDRRMMERSLELSSQELLQSNAEMRAILQAFPDHFFRIDSDGTVLEHKSADSRISPLKPGNPSGRLLADLVPDGKADLFLEKLTAALRRRQEVSFEYTATDPDQGALCFEARMIPLFADQLILIIRDITERKRSESAARERAERIIRYQAALLELSKAEQENYTGAIGKMLDMGLKTLDAHRLGLWLFDAGRTRLVCEDIRVRDGGKTGKGRSLNVSRHPRYFGYLEEARILVADDVSGDPHMVELAAYFRENGICATMDVPVRLQGRVAGILCIDHTGEARSWSDEDQDFAAALAQMISLVLESHARKTTEEALRSEEASLRSLFLAAPVGIAMQSYRKIRRVNERLCDMLGYAEGELAGRSPRMLYQTARQAKFIEDTMRTKLTAQGIGNIETRWIRKDGKPLDVLLTVVPLNASDLLAGVIFTALDITERKKVEEALAESEKRFRNYFELSLVGIAITTPQMDWIDVNDKLCDILGCTREEMLGMTWASLFVSEEQGHGGLEGRIGDFGKRDLSNVEVRMVKKDGIHVHALLSSRIVFNRDGFPDYILTLIQDVSDRKRLEVQLLQSQKLESIGTLAGGIAHDFNNLLMGIEGYASLILYDLDTDHPHYEKLRSIEEQVRSGAELTRQLLGFARGGKYEAKPTNVNTVIDRSIQLFGRTRREILMEMKLRPDLWTVEVDRGQIEQVLLNMYVNAWQAMPAGGTIYIETENLHIEPPIADCPESMMPGDYVRISVSDTGVGMDQKTKERIFDPFFTTKDRGRGTGLGLASAYGIIRNHGGFIHVYSEKGQGTTFTIYLPRSLKRVSQVAKTLEAGHCRGTETILVVDDEELNINVTRLILQKLGYQVITAGGGREALQIFRDSGRKIDLVIMDMIMPEMGGGETYDALKQIDPELKCILASGYSINGQAAEIMAKGLQAFIQKPFTMKDLSELVRRVLDGREGLDDQVVILPLSEE